MDIAILQSIDAAQTSGIDATLSGLSISASSFLSGLAKSKADIAKEKRATWQTSKSFVEKSTTPSERKTRQDAADLDKKDFDIADSEARAAAAAMKMLLFAFAAFVISLLERLTLKPIADRETLKGALDFAGLAAEQWLPVDLVLSSTTFAVGMLLLCVSARAIFKVIPKIE